MNKLPGIVRTLEEMDRLKCITRTAWTATGRKESTAEHSWRLAVFALMLLEEFPAADPAKLLSLCLVHDLGEAYDGDISAALHPDPDKKAASEARGLARLLADLPEQPRRRIAALAEEYNDAGSYEAKLVKALDKLETLFTHGQGRNPPGIIDHTFNLGYGRELCEWDGTLRELKELADRRTRARMEEQASSL